MSEDPAFDRFLDAVWMDVDRGHLRSPEEYLREYPGHEQAIRDEHRRIAEELGRQATAATGGGGVAGVERVGRYLVCGRLDEGGQGVLLIGRDPRLGRTVVIKTIGKRANAESLRRLRREAHLAGSLQHDGICPVLDLVEEGDAISVIMPRIEGEDLAARVRRARAQATENDGLRWLWASLGLPPETASAPVSDGDPAGMVPPRPSGDLRPVLRFVEKIAVAVHAAHEAGVIHRDINPRNVMVRPSGEPVVLDFGLAVETDDVDGTRLTREGSVMGTPPYMAPEQVEGRRSAIGRQTDVYALGVVLYELLTLQLPFPGTGQQLFDAIRRGYPPSPRRFHRTLPRDVESVCLRALHVDAERRYPTAQAFAADLRRVRTLEPTLARPVSHLERAWRRVRLHPWTAAAVAAMVVLAAVVVVVQTAARARDLEQQRRLREQEGELQALRQQLLSLREVREGPERVRGAGGVGPLRARLPAGLTDESRPEFEVVAQDPVPPVAVAWIRGGDLAEPLRVPLAATAGHTSPLRGVPDAPLAPGLYFWWVTAGDEAARPPEPADTKAFRVLDAAEWEGQVAASLPPASDDPIDRVRRAMELLPHKAFAEARRELDRVPAGIDPTLRGLHLLVLAALDAQLGDDPEGRLLSSVRALVQRGTAEEPLELAAALSDRAAAMGGQGRVEPALALARDALALVERHLGGADPRVERYRELVAALARRVPPPAGNGR